MDHLFVGLRNYKTFTFNNLEDEFIQSNLQARYKESTISKQREKSEVMRAQSSNYF